MYDLPAPPKRPTRFPIPNYEHRDTNYKKPPLHERLKIDELLDDTLLLPCYKRDFDFTPIGFPNELYRVGGVQMVKEYERRKEEEELMDADTSEESESSIKIYEKAYANYKPECGESNAESAERHRLIEQRVKEMKRLRNRQKEIKKSTRISTHFITDPQLTHTIDNKQRRTTERRNRISKEKNINNKPSSENEIKRQFIFTNNVQDYEFEEEQPLLDKLIVTQQINAIMDTGATFSMLPGHFEFAWDDLRPCLHTIEGCFKGGSTNNETQIGEFHALITLDTGETRRLIIPQAISLPKGLANSYLLAATPFLIADHRYTCQLQEPKLYFKGGGRYTMNVDRGHHIVSMTPTNAKEITPHKHILFHKREEYDPPTFHNHMTASQNTNRPNLTTPTAFVYHLRYGCSSEQVLRRTQIHVIGMEVQMGSWSNLKHNLPCNACLAGKMRKTRQAQSSAFTPMQNLALSWTPGTQDKVIIPNQEISTDWGIINKKLKAGQDNVFALYLDLNTGWVAAYPKANRGLAGETLAQYCQDFGIPKSILHDNAQEYLHGDFANLCREKQITQRMSAPHTPNQNPTEHYMDIIMGKTRCLVLLLVSC